MQALKELKKKNMQPLQFLIGTMGSHAQIYNGPGQSSAHTFGH